MPKEDVIEEFRHKLVEAGATLYDVQKLHGDEIRQKTREAYGGLRDAHMLIVGVLGGVLLRTNAKVVPATEVSGKRNALLASYVIGLVMCESAIEEGRYLQADALLRQEMDTLAQVKTRETSKRHHRKKLIGTLDKSLARLYDDLSAGAHVSCHEVVRSHVAMTMPGVDTPGDTRWTRYYPEFDREVARQLFTLHLLMTARLIEAFCNDIGKQHDDVVTERDNQALNAALDIMIAEGLLEATPEDA